MSRRKRKKQRDGRNQVAVVAWFRNSAGPMEDRRRARTKKARRKARRETRDVVE